MAKHHSAKKAHSKKSKKSGRSLFLSHMMKVISGSLGESLSAAFEKGDADKIKSLMVKAGDKLAAASQKKSSTSAEVSAAEVLREAGVPFLMHGTHLSVSSDVSSATIEEIFSRYNMRVNVDEDGNIIMQGRQRVSKSADDLRGLV